MPKDTETREVVIPLDGFYHSHHDEALDFGLRFSLCGDQGDIHSELYDAAMSNIRWSRVYLAYAQAYTHDFCEHHGLQTAEFVELDSPREYNFETDQIVIRLALSEIKAIYATTDRETRNRIAVQRHTSRSGFCSFYDPQPDHWEAWSLGIITNYLPCCWLGWKAKMGSLGAG